jgi:hypothetical protein
MPPRCDTINVKEQICPFKLSNYLFQRQRTNMPFKLSISAEGQSLNKMNERASVIF